MVVWTNTLVDPNLKASTTKSVNLKVVVDEFVLAWLYDINLKLDVSENRGTPKSSISIGFSIINHPFWGTPIFGNTQLS